MKWPMLAVALWLPALVFGQEAEDPAITEAKIQVAMKMKDPESARFTDLIATPPDEHGKVTVCGWINAKNSYGGYTGYTAFFVRGEYVHVRDSSAPYNMINFISAWPRCYPSPAEKFGGEVVSIPKIDIAKECKRTRKLVPNRPELTDACEQEEAAARAWLEDHETSGWIASICGGKLSKARRFGLTQLCVQELEAEEVLKRGPRIQDQSTLPVAIPAPTPSAAIATAPTKASSPYAPKPKEPPKNEYIAGKVARTLGCGVPALLSMSTTEETYQTACPGGQSKIIQCEFTNCRVMQ